MRRLESHRFHASVLIASAALICAAISAAQQASNPVETARPVSQGENSAVIARALDHILAVQEGDDKAEWPYEGVYRVGGEIPIGYRVGGTGINALALILAPNYKADDQRQSAVRRATQFIINAKNDPLMSAEYDGGYDVRGWGYAFGLTFLLKLKGLEIVPDEMKDDVEAAILFFVDAIQQTEIPQIGGWNYARGRGLDAVSPPSPFMTAPTLQALFEAKRMGYAVNPEVVERGLKSLEQARTPSGSIRYSGINGKESAESVPGSVGRMVATEATLLLAGRSDAARVCSAIDAFIVHWEWLEKRRCQQGTHVAPYGIAPYYFFYAHYYAAQAVELLPKHERAEYRRRIHELIHSVRSDAGTWNDRVFERSSNYGTSMAIMALMMPDLSPPARWEAAPIAE